MHFLLLFWVAKTQLKHWTVELPGTIKFLLLCILSPFFQECFFVLLTCVLLCFIKPILSCGIRIVTVPGFPCVNRLGPQIITWDGWILTLHLNYVAGYTNPLLFRDRPTRERVGSKRTGAPKARGLLQFDGRPSRNCAHSVTVLWRTLFLALSLSLSISLSLSLFPLLLARMLALLVPLSLFSVSPSRTHSLSLSHKHTRTRS